MTTMYIMVMKKWRQWAVYWGINVALQVFTIRTGAAKGLPHVCTIYLQVHLQPPLRRLHRRYVL